VVHLALLITFGLVRTPSCIKQLLLDFVLRWPPSTFSFRFEQSR
jgi:hypothetical protein